MSKLYIGFFILVFIICASLIIPEAQVDPETRVAKLLLTLGDKQPNHYPDTDVFGVSAERGKNIVLNGFSTRPGGGKTKRQSKHFKCTSCHNLEREDPDLRFADPEARLQYTAAKGMPFLQGTTLYGAVNRTTFYNGDYEKKYGKLVEAARHDIRGAIQLCAIECAQGRKLKKWELESVLAYLWTIDLKVKDLVFEDGELEFIEQALTNKVDQDSAISLINTKYLSGSPATFGTAHASIQKTEMLTGDPDNGKLIYDNSCQHCHEDQRYSYFLLDENKLTFKHLACYAEEGYTRHSIYQVARYGVYSKAGKRSYMPQYPMEKMSDQQLADLRAYIDMRASE